MAQVGKNMFDLRVLNRVAILNLLYKAGGMSRKEIAARLNLTPAAISHIVGDLIAEGVLIETGTVDTGTRTGRKEIMVEIDLSKFKVMCAYIPTRDVSISCIDLAGKISFKKEISFDSNLSGEDIVKTICDEMISHLYTFTQEERKWVIGVGIGIKGICDNERGVSVTSFGLWEDDLHVRDIAQERMQGLKVMIDNNIRCVANAELLFGSQDDDIQSMLFVKYGPLVGGAFVRNGELFRGNAYRAMEFGHFIVNPMGFICRCGKRGCLETMVGFDMLINSVKTRYSATTMPLLYGKTNGSSKNITYDILMQCYDMNEIPIVEIIDSALDHVALMINNSAGLVDPQHVILYGFPFESKKLMHTLLNKIDAISKGSLSCEIVKSSRNMQLDDLGCASIVIKDFFESGAKYNAID